MTWQIHSRESLCWGSTLLFEGMRECLSSLSAYFYSIYDFPLRFIILNSGCDYLSKYG